MWWIVATVTGSNMYIMLDQYAASHDIKQFTVSAITMHSNKSLHRSTILKPKYLCRRSNLEYHLFSFRECPLVLVLESLTRGFSERYPKSNSKIIKHQHITVIKNIHLSWIIPITKKKNTHTLHNSKWNLSMDMANESALIGRLSLLTDYHSWQMTD